MPPIGNAKPEFANPFCLRPSASAEYENAASVIHCGLNEVRIDMDEVHNSRAKNEDVIVDLKRKISQLTSEVERLQRHSDTNRNPWK